jgi:hypothetical protein
MMCNTAIVRFNHVGYANVTGSFVATMFFQKKLDSPCNLMKQTCYIAKQLRLCSRKTMLTNIKSRLILCCC